MIDVDTSNDAGLLSTSRISNTKPGPRDIWLSDDLGIRGPGRLLLRITPSGTRRFYFRHSVEGRRKTIPLGPYSRTAKIGYLTLDQARTIVRKHEATQLAKALSTISADLPHSQQAQLSKIEPSDEQKQSNGITLIDLCNSYVADLRRRKKISADTVGKELERHVASSPLANQLARTITPEQVTGLLRGLVQAGKGRTAARIRTHLRAAYAASLSARLNPGASELMIDPLMNSNPIIAIQSLSEFSVPRTRVLKGGELKEFWRRVVSPPNGKSTMQFRALRLAFLLGGQRCEQLLRVTADDVDFDAETILLHDHKGRRTFARAHLLPLMGAAKSEVHWLLRNSRDLDSSFLFPSSKPGEPLSANSVSALVTQIRKDMITNGTASTQFQFSDLRRTAETTLASLSVTKDVRAQLQSHGLGGVQNRHYDRYEYMTEKQAALKKWEQFLNNLLKP